MDYSSDYNDLPNSFFDEGDEGEDNGEETMGPEREVCGDTELLPEVQDQHLLPTQPRTPPEGV